ncbi:Phosphorus acquisition-controlling protein [Paramyrothecium foliicola]|nr:Phosphorus acquisition-controlling protein [Paramyrothecium foliicola]
MMSSAAWDGQDQPMGPAPEDEFHQFLDMSGMGNMGDGMQFEFQGFQDGTAQSMMAQQRDPTDSIMTDSDVSHMIPRTSAMMQAQSASISQAPNHSSISTHIMGQPSQADAISNIDAQIQYLQQQKLHQQQRQLEEQRAAFYANHNHSVPPTPQSLEMTPSSGQFYSQPEQVHQQGIYDPGYQRRQQQQDMAFTPLVSPAVTPLDPHFNMESAFTVPGAYFSPLTSPALHAQHDGSSAYDPSTHSNNSPIEIDLEAPATSANIDLSKKARRQNAAKARGKSAVKSSPISKPLRRKAGPSPAIVSQVLSEVEERNMQHSEPSLLPMPAASTDESEENASVSPENLTEMPPPPVPARRSTSKSPYIQAQSGGSISMQGLNEDQQHLHLQHQNLPPPATPTSLMKLPSSKTKKQSPSQQEHTVTDHIESLELPESVSSRSLSSMNAQPVAQLLHLESASSRNSLIQPAPSPIVAKPSGISSATQSPQLLPGSTGPSARKTPQLSARNSRKRSTGSVHVSPALLPRISPNIKPLLPGTPGMSAEDTASRLLMSKSNYQNILEGNTVPGVSYPSELSTNLTSKRTSHKIAEQGRRNRINSALQVMAGLLPDQGKSSGDDMKKEDSKQANAPNSKASVVENAIIHMQNLERENGDLKQELHELKEQLQKLKPPTDS